MAVTRGIDIEIVDNLTTDDAYSALSARQGMILNQKIENFISTSDIDSLFN